MRILILSVSVLLGCVPKIEPGPVPTEEATKPVQIIQMQDEKSPNLYLQAVVQAGSAKDGTGKEGLAHLTAEALVQAGAGEFGPEEIRKRLYPTGNGFELLVDKEFVSLRLRCHKDHAELCIDTFLSVLTQPRFEATSVERIRDEALYSITDGILSDEEALGDAVLSGLLFEGHPYGHPISGRAGTVGLLTADHARHFYEKHYLRSTARVGIGGAYTPEQLQTLTTGLERLGTQIPSDDALQEPTRVSGRQLLVVATETPVTGFHLGHVHGVHRGDEDWPALYLATLALGAHRQSSGRLFETLRTERGLNYGDYAYIESFKQRGWSTFPEQGALRRVPMFYLWLRPTATINGPFALKLAIDELEAWVKTGLDPEEFETVRQYAMGHLPLEAQNIGRRLSYALDANITDTPNLLETLPDQLRSLSVEQVNAAIQRHIHPENMVIVAVSGDGAQLVEKLKTGISTPIEYANVTPDDAQATRDAEIADKDIDVQIEQAEVRPAKGIFR